MMIIPHNPPCHLKNSKHTSRHDSIFEDSNGNPLFAPMITNLQRPFLFRSGLRLVGVYPGPMMKRLGIFQSA